MIQWIIPNIQFVPCNKTRYCANLSQSENNWFKWKAFYYLNYFFLKKTQARLFTIAIFSVHVQFTLLVLFSLDSKINYLFFFNQQHCFYAFYDWIVKVILRSQVCKVYAKHVFNSGRVNIVGHFVVGDGWTPSLLHVEGWTLSFF